MCGLTEQERVYVRDHCAVTGGDLESSLLMVAMIADEREARTREAIAVGIEALRDRDLEPSRTAPVTVPTDSAAGLVERAYNAAIDVAQKGGAS